MIASMKQPNNVGIKAAEIYFPGQTLDQAQFEVHQGVSSGKYTIGLGQTSMNFCNDREDVCSMALTAVSSLLRKFDIDPNSIGRLEVGTESIIDKAKSVKSVLTQLFPDNKTLEGVDNINACYGGTSALFNAINWVESRAWDGREAIVVASDIAIYKNTAARPTGGAGCVAMLIGPDAPLAIVPGLRGTFMTHAFDFYKPDFKSEYPLVDGQLSISCYLSALDGCYKHLRSNVAKVAANPDRYPEAAALLARSRDSLLDIFDYMAFHTPNCKLVSKSYARLVYNDFRETPDRAEYSGVPASIRDLSLEDSLTSKEVEKTFIQLSKDRHSTRVQPSIRAPTVCGNMYTASLYCSLLSLISNVDAQSLAGKTIGMFSYGSGIASSLFMLQVVGDVSDIVGKVDLTRRLKARHVATPQEYEAACQLRETAYGACAHTPTGGIEHLPLGAYYLSSIDERYRRSYAVKADISNGVKNTTA